MLPSLNSPIWCRARKDVEIIEAEVFSFAGYLKGKNSLMIFDRHANLKYKYGNRKLNNEVTTIFRYYIYIILSVVTFLFISSITLNKNLNQTVSVVVVGDNLIHPEFYRNAQIGKNGYDFKPIYQPIKKDIQRTDVEFINQESLLDGYYKPYSGFKHFNTPNWKNIKNYRWNNFYDMGITKQRLKYITREVVIDK